MLMVPSLELEHTKSKPALIKQRELAELSHVRVVVKTKAATSNARELGAIVKVPIKSVSFLCLLLQLTDCAIKRLLPVQMIISLAG